MKYTNLLNEAKEKARKFILDNITETPLEILAGDLYADILSMDEFSEAEDLDEPKIAFEQPNAGYATVSIFNEGQDEPLLKVSIHDLSGESVCTIADGLSKIVS